MSDAKSRNSNATSKQLRAIDNLVENGGNVSKAMRDAGYSAQTAKTPQKLTQSKAFQEVMAAAITDEKLIKVIKDGLDANRTISMDESSVSIPDYPTRHKYLETVLKVKGAFKDGDNGNTINFNFKGSATFNGGEYKK